MKYKPTTKEELKALCNNESIYLGDIDTSLITDMSGLFRYLFREDFSGIESWDVSNVEVMQRMFANSSFNQPLDSWDVGQVDDMRGMFMESAFNHPLDSWDVGNVKHMNWMFFDTPFNQPLNSWNVSNVEDMSYMFYCSSFNQPLDLWDVGEVWSMERMFEGSAFNQPLDSWNVSNVKCMEYMFANSSFNQPLFSWKICPMVQNSYMFLDTPYTYPLNHLVPKGYTLMSLIDDYPHSYPFDFASYPKIYTPKTKSVLKLIIKDKSIPLYAIDVSGVKDMSHLFAECGRQDWEFCGIESWDMSGVENVEGMFEGCKYSQMEKFCEMKGIQRK